MISYDDLCQALDRFNQRRNNAAELEQLDSAESSLAGPEAIDVGVASGEPVQVTELPAEDSLATDEGLLQEDDATVAHFYSEEDLAPLDGEPTQIADAPPMIALDTDESAGDDFDAAEIIDGPDRDKG